ncbi:hypothetical protein MIND_01349400 [Mycena indigotica]|uniref:Uncharacterized protein n=1 Tax=Mycena indigotica TaxID=2126181 RepID=A0A8H6VTQ8_9AGAR|nr:uncharacterized protein MIND_01349400 [Mycena indigotica]KAF7289758.1 hypothetical protein MIND_01349400 [Mycena indigotica]
MAHGPRALRRTPSISSSGSSSTMATDLKPSPGLTKRFLRKRVQDNLHVDRLVKKVLKQEKSRAKQARRMRKLEKQASGSHSSAYDADVESVNSSRTIITAKTRAASPSGSNRDHNEPRPLQPSYLSETIGKCQSPYLRAAKRSGIITQHNAEVDIAGEAVRFRVEDDDWDEGVVKEMKYRWCDGQDMIDEEL